MRILGASVRELTVPGGRGTIVALDADGRVTSIGFVEGLAALARDVATIASGEPFLLAVDVPVASASATGKPRRVDGWIQRRLGVRTGAVRGGGVTGGELLAALATAGQPCLPYPDRDRRRAGLAEIHAELVLKALVWESSAASAATHLPDREEVLRAIETPSYRGARLARAGWAKRFAALDTAFLAVSGADGFELRAVREELTRAVTVDAVERVAAAFDAGLLAAAARRYLDDPERSVFVGDRESGYTILPADAFLRRVVLRETARGANRGALFPRASVQDRLQAHAELRPMALIELPGRAPHFEAVFHAAPLFEFDNLDEMLWWKHCRQLDGAEVPQDGLRELIVRLEGAPEGATLRLARSRHRTLSFRFEPAPTWRSHLSPRDGRTYPFRILRAIYEAE